jgi:hypothetical protein
MVTRNRRAVLEGLGRILDSAGLEELFAGPDEEAAFLYDLLAETARARRSVYYWEICRTARRRGVTPEYVVDRATVLLAAMEERRRTDLYRILGVAPLASGEMIRQRWLEVAKRSHPDVGGDGAYFRRVKEAYEVLRDPVRRADYERFWLKAHGPFERIAPAEEREHLEVARRTPRPAAPVTADPGSSPEAERHGPRAALRAAQRLFAERDALAQRLGAGNGQGDLVALLGRLESALAAVSREEIEALRTQVEAGVAALERLRTQLAEVAGLKHRLAV